MEDSKAETSHMSDDVISDDDLKSAVERSGYLVESRVDALLRDRTYWVDANESYPDPTTGKALEIDLSALNAHTAGPKETDLLWSYLIVECVHSIQPIAFFTKSQTAPVLNEPQIKVAGLPTKIYRSEADKWVDLSDYLDFTKNHRYCAEGDAATQFCSFQRKKQSKEWMAWHDDQHFESFRKLCDATRHTRYSQFSKWTRFREDDPVNVGVFSPILVIDGRIVAVSESSGSIKIEEKEHVRFLRSTHVQGKEETFQIDVTVERNLPALLDQIEQEMTRFGRLLKRRGPEVRESIARIVRDIGPNPEKEKALRAFGIGDDE